MTDVIDVEFRRLKSMLLDKTSPIAKQLTSTQSVPDIASNSGPPPALSSAGPFPTSQTAMSIGSSASNHLDFSTLRSIHATYLERLLTGCLLSNPALTAIIRSILEVCERLVAQVERWGGDILPALLFEGSLAGSGDKVGEMVKERQGVVADINDNFNSHLESFYDLLSSSITQQPFSAATEASKSVIHGHSTANVSAFHTFIRPKRRGGDEEVRRHVERLLLRLDFSGEFSTHRLNRLRKFDSANQDILKEGGLV